jgi:hypothetical protein
MFGLSSTFDGTNRQRRVQRIPGLRRATQWEIRGYLIGSAISISGVLRRRDPAPEQSYLYESLAVTTKYLVYRDNGVQ